jgi:hypothetical protein
MRKKFIPEDDQAEIERELQLGSPGGELKTKTFSIMRSYK